MKKAIDRDILDKELKKLNRKLKALFREHEYLSVTDFMSAIDKEIEKRLKSKKTAAWSSGVNRHA